MSGEKIRLHQKMSLDERILVYKCAIKTMAGYYPSINSFDTIDWLLDNIKV
jgi:hypothetical protein